MYVELLFLKVLAKQSRFNNNIFLNMCFSYFFHIILNDNTTLSGVGMSFNFCIENVLFTKNKFSQLEKVYTD